MRKEFNALREKLISCNIYDEVSGDDVFNDVNKLVNDLDKKIDEVEKRMECITKTTRDIELAIGKYTDDVDNTQPINMKVTDHDSILRGSRDIMIAVDLADDEPIENNWYGLFKPEVVYSFEGSWGSIDCAMDGVVLKVNGDLEVNGEKNYLFDIARVDIAEYIKFCESKNITHGEALDILAVGFWRNDGTYEAHDKVWRENIFGVDAPTELCKIPQTHEFVKDIIAKLKVIDVDGETMEYILEQVGMTDQMLRQLVMNNPETDTKDLLAEKIELNNQRVIS